MSACQRYVSQHEFTGVCHIHKVFLGLIFTGYSFHISSGLRRLAAVLLRFSQLLLHPRNGADSTVHHGSVDLADAGARVQNL